MKILFFLGLILSILFVLFIAGMMQFEGTIDFQIAYPAFLGYGTLMIILCLSGLFRKSTTKEKNSIKNNEH